MKLMLGIPTGGTPAEPFLKSLNDMQLPLAFSEVENKSVVGNFVPAARELLVEYALERGADFLLMIDDDMIVPPDALQRLLDTFGDPNVALCGALYYSRDGLRPMVVDDWNPQDTTSASIPAFDDRTPVRVGGVGFGLAMVRTAAAARLARPLFSAQILLERVAGRVRICNEDYLFCRRLREAGWDVLLHPGVRCGHYDRASKTTFPRTWEAPEKTNFKRMFVRGTDGTLSTKPFDNSVERVKETHMRAEVDYILSEEF